MVYGFFRKVFFGRTVKDYGSFGGSGGFFGSTKTAFLAERGDRRKLVLRTRFGSQFHYHSLEKSDVENLIGILTDARDRM